MILPPKVKRRPRTPERLAREAKELRDIRVEAETQRLLRLDKERAKRDRPPRDKMDYDDPGQRGGKFIFRWVLVFGTREVRVEDLRGDKELLKALEDYVDDPDVFAADLDLWSNRSVGRILGGLKHKRFGSYMLCRAGRTGGVTRWQVINIAPSQFEEED
jgi:hypothetical protein